MSAITKRQLEVLQILDSFGGHCEGWGEVYSHYYDGKEARYLEMANFDRVCTALEKRKALVSSDEGISLTEYGSNLLQAYEVKP